MIDLYQANKEDQALVYEAVGLEPGMHELKVRVTGEKNAAASDCCIVADKIEVFRGETVCSHVDSMRGVCYYIWQIKLSFYSKKESIGIIAIKNLLELAKNKESLSIN